MRGKITPAKLIGAFTQMKREEARSPTAPITGHQTSRSLQRTYSEVLELPTESLQRLADALNEVWGQP